MSQKNLLSYCTETLEKGSVLSMEKGTPIVSVMPFKQIKGNAYSFNIIDTLLPTEHRELGEDVQSSEIQSEKITKSLSILTNSAKVDRALGVMSDITDLMAESQYLAMISSGKALEKKCIAELKAYLSNDNAGNKYTGQLDVDIMDDAIDYCEPNMIFVSNASHRALKKLLKSEGQQPETIDNFGKRVLSYSGIAVHVSQDIADNEVLLIRFAEDGVHGITNGGLKVYERIQGVHNITDTELLYNIIAKTKNSFALIEIESTTKRRVKNNNVNKANEAN